MDIYLIEQTESMIQYNIRPRKQVIAVCTSRKKAVEMIKSLIEEPCCERPIMSECTYDEELELGHIQNEYGYCCDYEIIAGVTDDWLD